MNILVPRRLLSSIISMKTRSNMTAMAVGIKIRIKSVPSGPFGVVAKKTMVTKITNPANTENIPTSRAQHSSLIKTVIRYWYY